jgi:uncharacterized repeat protein (TIGR03803 family)
LLSKSEESMVPQSITFAGVVRMSVSSVSSAASMRRVFAAAYLLALLGSTIAANAATEKVLYSFKGGLDGADPSGGLIKVGGFLYGTTTGGGTTAGGGIVGYGTVFKVTRMGVESVVYAFKGASDGAYPMAAPINVGGTLYGTTAEGGVSNIGTVYSVTPLGVENVIYSFQATPDAWNPNSGLINVGGVLFGASGNGGISNKGGVYSVTPQGTESILHSFGGGGDGAWPQGKLVHVGGKLFGTTYGGGSGNCTGGCGTAFAVTQNGTEPVLYSFKGGTDGSNPEAGLLNVSGTLYGTTYDGGAASAGTVFSITLQGVEKVIYSFKGGTDGEGPVSGLINVGGILYGTTLAGGGAGCASVNGCGTVFSVTPAGVENVIYAFRGGSDGSGPLVALISVGGVLYGTTNGGGGTGCGGSGCGTIFAITP